ncbi:hypothetical protein [Clostridium butyricum]
MEIMVNNMIVPSDLLKLHKNKQEFEAKLVKLEKYFSENIMNDENIKGLEKWLIDRYSSGLGCFGIMELGKDYNYFSLSGSMDYEGLKRKEKSVQFNILKNIIQSYFDFRTYIYSSMTDETLRYEKDLNTNNYFFINLGSDTEGQFDDIKKYYSCCERKMQAKYNDYTKDKIFYARWEPCSKCIPALEREQGNIRIFALAKNYKDWIKNKRKSKFRECNLSELIKTLEK